MANILILANKFDIYSNNRLAAVFEERGHQAALVAPRNCVVRLDGEFSDVTHNGQSLTGTDVVLLRSVSSVWYGMAVSRVLETAVARQLKMAGVVCVNDPEARLRASDKLHTLQILSQAGIPVPSTFGTWNSQNIEQIISDHLNTPLILKMTDGSWGKGIARADSLESARSVFEIMQSTDRIPLAQKYIGESNGQDIRVFVVGKEAVAAMRRIAAANEFRSNIHRGGTAEKVDLPKNYARIAVEAAEALGLEIAGVDILESNSGPLVLEVNSCPGLEKIEAVTKIDITAGIVKYIEKRVR